jgi:3-oxoacyl-[acyl-carrier protein] reductase
MDAPVAIVTGAGRGIGRYIADQLFGAGYATYGCSRTQPRESTRFDHRIVDVSDESQVKAFVADIYRANDRVDVVINNAGIRATNHVLRVSAQSLLNVINTNLVGSFLVARESAKVMRHRRFGRIVNITSVVVPLVLEGESPYVISKGGIETMTKVMSRELARYGITCNAVGPGPVSTDLIGDLTADQIQALANRLTIAESQDFADVYNVIDFLIRPQSGRVTGQIIYIGGA